MKTISVEIAIIVAVLAVAATRPTQHHGRGYVEINYMIPHNVRTMTITVTGSGGGGVDHTNVSGGLPTIAGPINAPRCADLGGVLMPNQSCVSP